MIFEEEGTVLCRPSLVLAMFEFDFEYLFHTKKVSI